MEVKTNEGVSSEAVISKLTDASLYTVGESLCLTAGSTDQQAGVSYAGRLVSACSRSRWSSRCRWSSWWSAPPAASCNQ